MEDETGAHQAVPDQVVEEVIPAEVPLLTEAPDVPAPIRVAPALAVHAVALQL